MRENLKRATAYLSLVAAVTSAMPLPVNAFETSGYSSTALDRGIVVGVYDSYFKELKLFHYWMVRGKGYTDKDSNTICSPNGKVLEVAFSSRKISCPSGWRTAKNSVAFIESAVKNPNVKVSPLVNSLYYCPTTGQYGYKTDSGYFQASVSLSDIALCRRIVDPAWINKRYRPNTPFSRAVAGTNGGIRNVWFTQIGFGGNGKGAVQLMNAYMQATGASAGLLITEGLHFHKHKHKCGLFKKCVDYIWDEDAKYYEFARAESPIPLGYGIYMSSQGIGNNLYIHKDRIKKITKKGWSFIAVVVAQVALVALTGGLGAPTLVTYALGMGFATSNLVSGMQGHWGSGMYNFGEGITPGVFNDFKKDTGVSSDPGSRALHTRFVRATDLSPGVLDGFIMANRIYNNYRKNWTPSAPLTTAVVIGSADFKAKSTWEKVKEDTVKDELMEKFRGMTVNDSKMPFRR